MPDSASCWDNAYYVFSKSRCCFRIAKIAASASVLFGLQLLVSGCYYIVDVNPLTPSASSTSAEKRGDKFLPAHVTISRQFPSELPFRIKGQKFLPNYGMSLASCPASPSSPTEAFCEQVLTKLRESGMFSEVSWPWTASRRDDKLYIISITSSENVDLNVDANSIKLFPVTFSALFLSPVLPMTSFYSASVVFDVTDPDGARHGYAATCGAWVAATYLLPGLEIAIPEAADEAIDSCLNEIINSMIADVAL